MSKSRHFSRGRILLFLIIVGGFLYLDGNRKIPSGPAGGDSLNGPAPATRPSGDVLRLATFNIDGGVGLADNRLDLDRTAAAIRGFDVIGLEEVHGATPVLGGSDQAQILGEKLSLPWIYAPVESQWWRPAFGDALLTDLPVKHWMRIPLSANDAESNREVLLSTLEFGGRDLHVLVTHLQHGIEGTRDSQFSNVIAIFQALEPPAIMMGDFNSYPSDPLITQLQNTPGIVDATSPGFSDKFRDNIVDWIFARGMVRVDGGFIDNGASDHPVSWAALRYPSPQ